MNPAEQAKAMMDKIKADSAAKDLANINSGTSKFVIDEPGKTEIKNLEDKLEEQSKNPEPIKIIPPNKPEQSVPIDNLIKEAKKVNMSIPPKGREVIHTKLDQIKAILRGGGMDSMSVEKCSAQIKEVVEL